MEADRRLDAACAAYNQRLHERAEAISQFEATENTRREEIDHHNATVLAWQRGLEANEHTAVVGYFKLIINRSLEGEPDAISAEVGYGPDSRHLVVDLELPELSAVPEETGFRYVKSTDRIDHIIRPPAKRKALYSQSAVPSRAQMHRYCVPRRAE